MQVLATIALKESVAVNRPLNYLRLHSQVTLGTEAVPAKDGQQVTEAAGTASAARLRLLASRCQSASDHLCLLLPPAQ